MNKYVIILGFLVVQPSFATTIDDLYEDYGIIDTIAGTAFITAKAQNGWTDDMEGGAAVDAELSRPHMAMADIAGNVYIADKDAHAVRVVRTNGTMDTVAGVNVSGGSDILAGKGTEVPLASPNGLYTFPDGTTYILDLGNSMVRKLTTDGDLTTLFEDETGMTLGRGLWVSPDESLVYFSSGSVLKQWTPEEGVSIFADGFVALGNIAIDPTDGNLVATDREAHVVYKVFEDGDKDVIAGNGDTRGGSSGDDALDVGLKEVRGVAFNPDGTFFLATHDGGQIWFVDTEERIHLFIDGDDDGTHAGDGELVSTGGKKISEPRAITLAPNKDLLITEHDGGYIRRVEWVGDPVFKPGDYNFDGVLDVTDVDTLAWAIRSGKTDDVFDLDGNRQVQMSDLLFWVKNLRNTYFGDANLDGEFNSNDFVLVFRAGEYEDNLVGNSTWATGDWNGDGEFTSSDFVEAFRDGGYELGPRNDVLSVPEPSALGLLSLAVVSWGISLTTRRKPRFTGNQRQVRATQSRLRCPLGIDSDHPARSAIVETSRNRFGMKDQVFRARINSVPKESGS